MRKTQALNAVLLSAALLALGLMFAAPIAAKPGWSHPAMGELELTREQQQQMRNLRSAFQDQLKSLDWSVQQGGHAADTLQQARELRLALRAEMRAVLTDEQRLAMDAARRGTCPHSGEGAPVRVQQQTTTLYL